jgi:hypothetical protein
VLTNVFDEPPKRMLFAAYKINLLAVQIMALLAMILNEPAKVIGLPLPPQILSAHFDCKH